jgi:hemophore
MKSGAARTRRRVAAVFAVTAAGGVALTLTYQPTATAGVDPCSASEVAKSIGMVATSTGTYLDSHPDANQALTAVSQQQPGPQSVAVLKTYFDAHPQEGSAIQQLQQPLVTLSSRCKLPLTLPQLMGLMQSAQGGGLSSGLPTLPGALPGVTTGSGAVPPAQAVSAPAGGLVAPSVAAAAPAAH